MSVLVKLSAFLRELVPDYNVSQGLPVNIKELETASGLAEKLGLPLKDIKIVMINGRRQPLDHVLTDGDRVAYFPPVGGG